MNITFSFISLRILIFMEFFSLFPLNCFLIFGFLRCLTWLFAHVKELRTKKLNGKLVLLCVGLVILELHEVMGESFVGEILILIFLHFCSFSKFSREDSSIILPGAQKSGPELGMGLRT